MLTARSLVVCQRGEAWLGRNSRRRGWPRPIQRSRPGERSEERETAGELLLQFGLHRVVIRRGRIFKAVAEVTQAGIGRAVGEVSTGRREDNGLHGRPVLNRR